MTAVLEHMELGFPWTCLDPFLFTVHHLDRYPEGLEHQGPSPDLLSGRPIGTDFTYQDGWSMYHGDKIPGFPQHPHRGFETVTVVRRGFVDHSDSLGATARYGEGDVQWLTTGSGIMHAEMFPLIRSDGPNTMELFQIWLNLPPESKMVPAYFGMLWSEEIPTMQFDGGVAVDVMAGRLADQSAPPPPPDSWASRPESDLAIWLIKLPAGTEWTLPAAGAGVNRMLYCFVGSDTTVDDTQVQA
ncbi:MAG: pirin family protein, partial [Acidimicrobiia bacterium]|nr:pirin family protein [Acidimicrobiia bacterium]